MNTQALERLVMENSLRRAIERDEFRIYYQPIVDVKTGNVSGMEALVRWEHPNLGLIMPGQFIPLAEETGLIVPLGEWTLRRACLDTKKWNEGDGRNLQLSVNLSARQFYDEDLVHEVSRSLTESGLDSEHLAIELTESYIMRNAEESASILKKINAMGVKVSIDDFGTGYSSLSYLKRFPIRTLKIDRSFINDISTDLDDAAIVKAIISMAHSLKIEVVGEGVETEEQKQFLSDNKCDKLQGFLISRPLPVDAFEAFLKSHTNA